MLISDAFRGGSLLVATVLAGGLWWVVGCTPISIDPGSDAAPSIVGRNGAVAYPFGGFVYPPSGPVEYPGHWGTAGVMELDVPLRSLARGDEGLELGPPYYAFTVNVRVEGLRTLLLQWGSSAPTPCNASLCRSRGRRASWTRPRWISPESYPHSLAR